MTETDELIIWLLLRRVELSPMKISEELRLGTRQIRYRLIYLLSRNIVQEICSSKNDPTKTYKLMPHIKRVWVSKENNEWVILDEPKGNICKKSLNIEECIESSKNILSRLSNSVEKDFMVFSCNGKDYLFPKRNKNKYAFFENMKDEG